MGLLEAIEQLKKAQENARKSYAEFMRKDWHITMCIPPQETDTDMAFDALIEAVDNLLYMVAPQPAVTCSQCGSSLNWKNGEWIISDGKAMHRHVKDGEGYVYPALIDWTNLKPQVIEVDKS